jgi:hypothetical protein
MAIPSQPPVRYPSGISFDYRWGPLADYGQPHPFSYHTWKDDFDILEAAYTATKTGNGTIAVAAGDGGKLLFTTNSSTPAGTDVCSIQLPAAGFGRPAASVGKKIFFLCRLQLSSATNAAFNVGLIQTTATPFTVTDGIYFTKATGALNNLKLRSTIGSVNTDLAIPTGAYTLANATDIDLAFAVDRNGVIYAYVGSQLVGWLPPSSQPTGQVRGPVGSLTPSITTANLNPTLAIQSGTAASSTMTVDFAMAAKER